MQQQENLQTVPRENWLYPDRGMAKWMGWLLSDHSAYLSEAAKSEQPEQVLPEMTASAIDARLQEAWSDSKVVSVQLTPLYDNQVLPAIKGAVIGISDNQVVLLQNDNTTQAIDVTEIRHVKIIEPEKWWNQSSEDTTHITLQRPRDRQRQLNIHQVQKDTLRPLPNPLPGTPFADPSQLPQRDLMCIDCKSFYASVEAIRRAEYPLAAKNAVLSREESAGGLILAASPLCKTNYGVKLGTRSYELKPSMDIQIVEPHMSDYIRINYTINDIYRHYTTDSDWYVYSIDESFLDVTESHGLFGCNEQIATAIQDEVFETTGIVATVGIGDNPLLAKLALDNEAKVRPPWQATWTYQTIPEKLWPIDKLTDFWSIGSKTALKLQRMGIYSLGDVAHTPQSVLHDKLGVLGDALYYHSWGIDYSLLQRRYVPRTDTHGYGNSQVLMRDYVLRADCETVLAEITDQVATRLRKRNLVASNVAIEIGFSEPDINGKTHFGAQTNIDATNRTDELVQAVHFLFAKKWNGQPLRNMGVRVTKVKKPFAVQISLFEPIKTHDANDRLEHTIDQIRDRFGFKALVRASSKTAGGTAIDRAGLVGGHQG